MVTKAELLGILERIRDKWYHYPDSDFYEYCNGCGRSPYNFPPHDPGCLVVDLDAILTRSGRA